MLKKNLTELRRSFSSPWDGWVTTPYQKKPAEFDGQHSPKQCKVLLRFSGASVFSFIGVEYFLSINCCFSLGVLLVSGFFFFVALRGSANIRTSLGNAVSTCMAPAFILASNPSSVPNSSVCEILYRGNTWSCSSLGITPTLRLSSFVNVQTWQEREHLQKQSEYRSYSNVYAFSLDSIVFSCLVFSCLVISVP